MIRLDRVIALSTRCQQSAVGVVCILAILAAADGRLAVSFLLLSQQLHVHADIEAVGNRDVIVSAGQVELALCGAFACGGVGLAQRREDLAAVVVGEERVSLALAVFEGRPLRLAGEGGDEDGRKLVLTPVGDDEGDFGAA